MKTRIMLILILLNPPIYSEGQTIFEKGMITDSRDGKTYQTIKIGNLIWIAENLKYQTKNSVDITKYQKKVKLEGYYYPYEESDEVCPNGFRIPKLEDWKNYINRLIKLKNAVIDSSDYFSTLVTDASGFEDKSGEFKMFEEPNPLNLKKSGWIQGKKLKLKRSLNLWLRIENSMDRKYHLHILSEGYSKHSHKHHIDDKKRRKRKFVMRCVKNKLVD